MDHLCKRGPTGLNGQELNWSAPSLKSLFFQRLGCVIQRGYASSVRQMARKVALSNAKSSPPIEVRIGRKLRRAPETIPNTACPGPGVSTTQFFFELDALALRPSIPADDIVVPCKGLLPKDLLPTPDPPDKVVSSSHPCDLGDSNLIMGAKSEALLDDEKFLSAETGIAEKIHVMGKTGACFDGAKFMNEVTGLMLRCDASQHAAVTSADRERELSTDVEGEVSVVGLPRRQEA